MHEPARIPELDGVRGLAILLVLVYHYGVCIGRPEAGSIAAGLKNALALSLAGVDLFFVLSGFLIGGILLRNRDAANYFSAFYARRSLRLMPLYMLMLAIYGLASAPLLASGTAAGHWLIAGDSPGVVTNPIPLWSYYLYLQNLFMAGQASWGSHWLSITWSLAVEEQFYLVAPLMIWAVPRRLLPRLLTALIVAAPIARAGVALAVSDSMPPYVLLPCRWDALFIGMLAALYVSEPDNERWLRSNARLLVRSLIGMLILGAGAALAGCRPFTPVMITIGHSVLALASLNLILVALYADRGWVTRLFRNGLLTRIGVVSYGVYLLHMGVLGLASHWTTGLAPQLATYTDLAIVALALGTTFAMAELSWRYFEKPFIGAGRRIPYRRAALA